MVYYNIERKNEEVFTMKLTFGQIKSACSGAVNITQEDGLVRFHRMQQAQLDGILALSETYYIRAHSTAGVKLDFRTDSTSLFLDVNASRGTMSYFAVDIIVNGKLIGSVDNFSHEEIPVFHAKKTYQLGDYSGRFDLGPGEKTVRVHLPWGPVAAIRELSLDDGATFTPAVPEKKVLFYGDSITQGMDCLHPSQTYSARIADALGMAEYNKAIAGTPTYLPISAVREEFTPDVVVVAYGTNDWTLTDTQTFRTNYRTMHEHIRSHYPGVPVFALTPLFRYQMNECRVMGAFCKVAPIIQEICADFPDVTVIDCFPFIPRDHLCFGDGILHPNARGFDYYFKGLWPQMKAVLKGRCL